MAINSENIKTISRAFEVDPTGTPHTFHLMKAPRDLTVLSAYMVAEVAQNAGTAVKLRLENWGTAGTAVEGTVAAFVGGTAVDAQLAALTPEAAVIDADQDYIEEGEWLVINYTEEGAGWVASDRFVYVVNYVIGLGA